MDVRLYHDSVVMLHFKETNRSVGALVDTGAAASCCALSLLRRLLPNYTSQMLPIDKCFSTADGKSEKFYVFPQLNRSMILGRTFYTIRTLCWISPNICYLWTLFTSSTPLNTSPPSPILPTQTWTVSLTRLALTRLPGVPHVPHNNRLPPAHACLIQQPVPPQSAVISRTQRPIKAPQMHRTPHSTTSPATISSFRQNTKPNQSVPNAQDAISGPGFHKPDTLACPTDTTTGSAAGSDVDSARSDKLVSDNNDRNHTSQGHNTSIPIANTCSDEWVPDSICPTNATTAHIEGLDSATITAKQRPHAPFLDLIKYLQHGLAPTTKKRYLYCVSRENTHGLFGPHQLLVIHQPNRDGTPGVRVLVPPCMRAELVHLYHAKLLHHSGMFKTISKLSTFAIKAVVLETHKLEKFTNTGSRFPN